MEEITLEKIDILRERAGLSYAEARDLLEKNNGSVVDALIYLENNKKTMGQNVSDFGDQLLGTVKDIVKKGNVSRIKIKKDDKVLVDIPLNAGIAAGVLTLYNPLILAAGTVAAIASKIVIEVERPDGNVEVINDIVKKTYNEAAQKAGDFKDKAFDAVKDFKNESSSYDAAVNRESTDVRTDNQEEEDTKEGNNPSL